MSYDEIIASLGSTMTEENAEVAETRAVELADCVWAKLAELYEAYYQQTGDIVKHRADVKDGLACLMRAYDVWLG